MTTTNDSEGGMAKTEAEMHDYWKCDIEGLGCANDPDHCGECGAPPNHPNHTCYQPSEIAAARTDACCEVCDKPVHKRWDGSWHHTRAATEPTPDNEHAVVVTEMTAETASAASESSHDFEDEDADWRKQPVALDDAGDSQWNNPLCVMDCKEAGDCDGSCARDEDIADARRRISAQPAPAPEQGAGARHAEEIKAREYRVNRIVAYMGDCDEFTKMKRAHIVEGELLDYRDTIRATEPAPAPPSAAWGTVEAQDAEPVNAFKLRDLEVLGLRRRIHQLERHNQDLERCESAWCNPTAKQWGWPAVESATEFLKKHPNFEAFKALPAPATEEREGAL